MCVGRSVGRSIRWSHFIFFMFFILCPHCSCPNCLVTSNTAPARPQATEVTVYSALFLHPRYTPKLLSLFHFATLLSFLTRHLPYLPPPRAPFLLLLPALSFFGNHFLKYPLNADLQLPVEKKKTEEGKKRETPFLAKGG